MQCLTDNRLAPNDRPQYRTGTDFRSRLSTLLLGNLDDAIDKYVKNLSAIISGDTLPCGSNCRPSGFLL